MTDALEAPAPQPAHPGHLVPAGEWPRVQADAAAHAGHEERVDPGLLTLSRSAFPSVTGFVQCKYDGGAQPAGGPRFGVLHDAETPLSAGYAASIASYFTRNTNETSAHFMVDPVATIQMLDTSRIAWHVGNGNTRSIGVEQAGYASFTTAQWETAAGQQQMARVAALMRDIHAAHGIGLFWMTDAQLTAAWKGQIVGGWATHSQCSRVLGGSTHTDPMPNYPLGPLMALANQGDDMSAQAEQQIAEMWKWMRGGDPNVDNFTLLWLQLKDVQSMLRGGNTGGKNNFHWLDAQDQARADALIAELKTLLTPPKPPAAARS